MAKDLSQEALLDFLCEAGGRVTNAALLGHFKGFLRDPGAPPHLTHRRREQFKAWVNQLASVRPGPNGTKFVVLRRRYRGLLGEGDFGVEGEGPRERGTAGGRPGGLPQPPGVRHPPPSLVSPGSGGPFPLPPAVPQERTRDWVARLPTVTSPCPDPSLGPAPAPSLAPGPPPIFRSIRCQLDLQDLGDFVEQVSTCSEESSSSDREEEAGPGLALSPPPEAGPSHLGPSPRSLSPQTPLRTVRAKPTRAEPPAEPKPVPREGSLVPLDVREHEWTVRLASGAWARVLALLREDPRLALRRDFVTGYTALHWAAKHGDRLALRGLVHGAGEAGLVLDVNARSGCGYTPLHLAAMHGRWPAMKLLVRQLGCRVDLRDVSGRRPWQYLDSNSTTGDIWQLLGAPRGKPIFPTVPLPAATRSPSPSRRARARSRDAARSRDGSRSRSRKPSLAALFKGQQGKRRAARREEEDDVSD
ncbi:ankyrin repeat domain-containing protein SOWAHB [Ornithorhynchus anatinus]|uniref:ankyrin repeat domain-containing protein SOWAHB n=1 Tax=Ornithorhynchus anatinus TaxID=9258 RepID=UPI0010A858DC|nr:ankyrin repeat domain-containing protein SOWAHB [Ornithorhynchus anatinus]